MVLLAFVFIPDKVYSAKVLLLAQVFIIHYLSQRGKEYVVLKYSIITSIEISRKCEF